MSRAYWYALASVSGLGSVMARKLLAQFGTVDAVFQASDQELLKIPRFTAFMRNVLRELRLEKFQTEIETLAREGIEVVTWDDARFPNALRELKDAPMLLFVRGVLRTEDETGVTIVGTRAASKVGMQVATTLARELAARNLTIVSGLELGIDTAAHLGALDAAGGRNIAIIGSGMRTIQAHKMADRIAQHGVVLTEQMPDTPLRALQLKARDRLINGLSRAVMVVEANIDSAALATAERARDKGNLVYAVSGSEGAEQLLRSGVKRLDAERLDFDALADEIAKHILAKREDEPMPQQGTLF